MLRNRYTKYIGGISAREKIIFKKPQEGGVLIFSLGIGGLTITLTLIFDVLNRKLAHRFLLFRETFTETDRQTSKICNANY